MPTQALAEEINQTYSSGTQFKVSVDDDFFSHVKEYMLLWPHQACIYNVLNMVQSVSVHVF